MSREHVPPEYDLTRVKYQIIDGDVYIKSSDVTYYITTVVDYMDNQAAGLINNVGLSSLPVANECYIIASGLSFICQSITKYTEQAAFASIVEEPNNE